MALVDARLAVVLWLITLVAIAAALHGNPTAISAVIGIGIPALAVTAVAVRDRLRR